MGKVTAGGQLLEMRMPLDAMIERGGDGGHGEKTSRNDSARNAHGKPKDATQRARSTTAQLRSAAHGAGRTTTSGLITPQQLSKDARQWATKLSQTPDAKKALRLFHRSQDGVHNNFLEAALGKLSPEAVQKLMPNAGRRALLADACVHAYIDRMAMGVGAAFQRAEARLDKLIASPNERAAAWKAAGDRGGREKLLVGLGVKPDQARALAREGTAPDAELLAALRSAKTRVTATKDDTLRRMRLAKQHPSDAIALFSSFGGHAKLARKSLELRSGSFADRALAGHIAAGKRDQKLFKFYQNAFGVLASLVSGGIVGASILAGAAAGGGAAAVMGARGLVAQGGQRETAQLTEALKIADKGTLAKAKQAFKGALTGYLSHVLLGAAAGAAGKATEHLATKWLKKLLGPSTEVLRGVGMSDKLALAVASEALGRLALKHGQVELGAKGAEVLAHYLTEAAIKHLSALLGHGH